MTADPKRVPDARVLDELHYREAAELAFYGAKVLHPRTMIPIVDRKIPLFVRNTFKPELPGTRIAHDVQAGEYPVKALTAVHAQSLVSIEGGGMGIGCEPASATTLAGVRKLREAGVIQARERIVCVLTGHVLKDPDAVVRHVPDGQVVEIDPTIEAVEGAI